jgi:uncharacterized protein involved in exopolysaccharide biosynthesis
MQVLDGRGAALGESTTPRTGAPESVSLVRLLAVPLRHRRSITRWSLALGLGLTAGVLVRAREYKSTAAFFPQGGRLTSALSGVAAQFGLGLPAQGDASRSPQFYVDLLHSRDILARIVERPFGVSGKVGRAPAGPSATLVAVFTKEGRSAAWRRDEAIRKLDDRMRVQVAEKTGVVTVSVTTPDAGLSQQVVAQLLAEVSRFNLETRRTQATAERQFAERRLADARGDLRRAEDRLRVFLEGNRELSFSPGLQTERGRLVDAISQQRQLVVTLTQSYEQARLDEVRDTPVITVMDAPQRPARAEPRRLPVWTALGVLLGAILGLVIAYAREYLRAVRRGDAEGYAQFEALRSAAARDFRSPVALLVGGNGAARSGPPPADGGLRDEP